MSVSPLKVDGREALAVLCSKAAGTYSVQKKRLLVGGWPRVTCLCGRRVFASHTNVRVPSVLLLLPMVWCRCVCVLLHFSLPLTSPPFQQHELLVDSAREDRILRDPYPQRSALAGRFSFFP